MPEYNVVIKDERPVLNLTLDVMELSLNTEGIQGPMGPQGPAGDSGVVVGPEGPQGPQGLQGIKGDTGAQGQKGDAGSAGSTGPKGDTGAQGIQGEQGETGPQGLQGIQGLQGVKGDRGDTGPAGQDGIDGLPGADGVDGAEGPVGPAGEGASWQVIEFDTEQDFYDAMDSNSLGFEVGDQYFMYFYDDTPAKALVFTEVEYEADYEQWSIDYEDFREVGEHYHSDYNKVSFNTFDPLDTPYENQVGDYWINTDTGVIWWVNYDHYDEDNQEVVYSWQENGTIGGSGGSAEQSLIGTPDNGRWYTPYAMSVNAAQFSPGVYVFPMPEITSDFPITAIALTTYGCEPTGVKFAFYTLDGDTFTRITTVATMALSGTDNFTGTLEGTLPKGGVWLAMSTAGYPTIQSSYQASSSHLIPTGNTGSSGSLVAASAVMADTTNGTMPDTMVMGGNQNTNRPMITIRAGE